MINGNGLVAAQYYIGKCHTQITTQQNRLANMHKQSYWTGDEIQSPEWTIHQTLLKHIQTKLLTKHTGAKKGHYI